MRLYNPQNSYLPETEISYGEASARIKSITQLGVVTIYFDRNMSVENFNLASINASNTQLYVNVTQDRLVESIFDASKMNFTWELTSFEGN